MKTDACNDVILGPATAECLRTALELVLRPLSPDDRPRIIDQTLRSAAEGGRSLDGLFVARRGRRVVGAVWAEIQPGRTAGVWSPQVADTQAQTLESALLARATDFLRDHQVVIAQALVAADAHSAAEAFRSAGFEHLTDLLYLVSTSGQFPTAPVAHKLIFEQVLGDNEARLATIVEATYEQTLDCPRLNGVRDCRDVLAGYRDTSHDDTSHWFLALNGARDVGCLLLARHAEIETWEVVYMGLAAEARGQGWGVELARQAQWLVRAAGGDRLMLAVDAANEPAIKTYAAAGFVTFDRRRVFVRFFDG